MMLSILFLALLQPTDMGVRQVGTSAPARSRSRVAPGKITQRTTFSCSVASITDGDTFRCADGTRVRLAGIDAPEVSACAKGRQCVAGDGQASRRSLASYVSGRMLRCQPVGTSYKRVVAFCSRGPMDLSCAQVRAGQAVVRYARQERVCR
jgi:endonuclease YncB( thermonuclease family)